MVCKILHLLRKRNSLFEVGFFITRHFVEACRKRTSLWSPAVPKTGQKDVFNSEGFVADCRRRGEEAVSEARVADAS